MVVALAIPATCFGLDFYRRAEINAALDEAIGLPPLAGAIRERDTAVKQALRAALIGLLAGAVNAVHVAYAQVGPDSYFTVELESVKGNSLEGRRDTPFNGFSNTFTKVDALAEPDGRLTVSLNYTSPRSQRPLLYFVVRNGSAEVIEQEPLYLTRTSRQDLGVKSHFSVKLDFLSDNWEVIRDNKWRASVIVSDWQIDL